MSGWVDLVLAGAAILGPILGHRRATKIAATASQVRRMARDAAFAIAALYKNNQAAAAAALIDAWGRRFDQACKLAGVELTDKQEDEALVEARRVFQEVGQASMGIAADRLHAAVGQLSKEMARLAPTLKRIAAEQAAAKTWSAKHPEDKR